MNSKYSPFGNYLIQLKNANLLTLAELGEKMDVSISYISSVCSGNREIPPSWRNKIISIFSLKDAEIEKLDCSIRETPNNHKVSLDVMYNCFKNMIINNVDDEHLQQKLIKELELKIFDFNFEND